ncbi:MAG: response regulator [Acidobacteriota bacterium]
MADSPTDFPGLDTLRHALAWRRESYLLVDDQLTVLDASVGDTRLAGLDALVGRPLDTLIVLDDEARGALLGDRPVREVVRWAGRRVELVVVPIPEPGQHLLTARDLSNDDRRARAQERFELAVRAAEKGLWDWDAASDETYISPRFEAIIGYARGKMPRSFEHYATRHIHPDDLPTVFEARRRLINEAKPYHIEYRIQTVDGDERWIDSRSLADTDIDGRVIRMGGSIDDITDRKRAADERVLMERRLQDFQKLDSLGVLAGGIAHDFNNLLTGILGNCNLAQMSLAPHADVQRDLREIEQAALRAAELCQQMLAYSGRGHFAITRVDLREIARETVKLVDASLPGRAEVHLELAGDTSPIEADAAQVRQVLTSLLFNASEALSEEGGTIRVSVESVDLEGRPTTSGIVMPDDPPPGHYTVLDIRDDGAGMEADILGRIFDPFFTTKFTGRGLGLAAVLGIVRGHQGAVVVDSEPGVGSHFRIFLPATPGDITQVIEIQTPDARPRGGTLLVIDDEEMIRLLASRILEKEGFRVMVARDGFEGIARFREESDQIVGVLLDLTMPNMDGVETFHELRRLAPELTVVMMSGFSEDDVLADGGERLQGLAGFIKKPFQASALRSKIRAALG